MAAKVLIVDDAIFMRNMLRNIFAENGFEVAGEAANGLEAIQKFQELAPSVVTMDIVMPERNGIDALKEIIKLDPDAKVIMCSALGQESLIIEAIEAGAKDYIIKPFKASRVIEVVQKILGEK
jgi:two-component system chemotaxis response regulator CheY